MKKVYILGLFVGLILSACRDGAPGPQGPPGIDGLNAEESFVFEYEFSFTAPDYAALLELPSSFTMLDSDVMLVYFLWDVIDGVEVWRSLPQTLFLADGVLQYNFDHTKFDANVFLDGTVNLDMLGADFTDNWIARVVVVPGQYYNGRSAIDFSDYNQVKALFNLSDSKLASESYSKRPG